MAIKMVLFDLDGTLLPMDQDKFMRAYFGGLARRLAPIGYDPDKLIKAIWGGSAAMVKNDGKMTNEDVFWAAFSAIYGKDARADEPYFYQYYVEDFDKVKDVCGYEPKAKEAVRAIKDMGFRVALATNPLFPSIATEKRISWCGLDKSEFELFTTYENSSYCKPNLDYYREVTDKLGVKADECLMVGNDVQEDMITEKLGMKVFLLTRDLINKGGEDISRYPNGGFEELLEFVERLR